MSCNTARIAATRAREETAATQPDARATFTDLPRDIVNEILGLANPADLARLRAVNRAMRNAVAETGRFDLNVDTHVKLELGCLGALQRRRLSRQFGTVARSGQLEKLKDLRANGCPWNKWTCAWAADGGHIKVLKWARANGCPWDKLTSPMAAFRGHLDVLKWARANGCPWDAYTCELAALGGHLEVLQWLRANGCPSNKWTCACAAVRGHLEVLKWLRANGCPWNTMTFLMAKEGGHLEVMRWALANGCPQPISCCFCLPPKHVP